MNNNEMTVQNEQRQNMPAAHNGISAQLDNINQGTIAIEASRAIAEAQGKLTDAKRNPRNEIVAFQKVMEACSRPAMALSAFYKFPRGNQSVEGPTIRFAEELARCWCNIEYGIRELSQDNGKSEMQVYAWDLETNTQSVQNFTNLHQREVNGKMRTLTSLRDIYENNANMATRRLRSRILAVLPNWLVDEAIKECKKTLKSMAEGNNEMPLIDRIKNMVVQFAKYGVTKEQIETRLKRKIDTMNADDFVEYIGIFNAIKDGTTKVADWFEAPEEAAELTAALKEG